MSSYREEIKKIIDDYVKSHSEKELEYMCTRCGKCCYQKAKINGEVLIFKNQPCRFLEKINDKEFKCKVYPDRLKMEPNCRNLVDIIVEGGLPSDCEYVKLLPKDWKPAKEVDSLKDVDWYGKG